MKLRTGEVIEGPAGTATEQLMDAEQGDGVSVHATLATWLIHCPGQSPAWQHYLLSIIHLRPIGDDTPTIRSPGATHEVFLAALNPSRKPVPDDAETWQHLTPLNVMEQVELPDDEAGQRLARLLARAVVDGRLPAEPPSSFTREPWLSSLMKTTAHMRGESHAS